MKNDVVKTVEILSYPRTSGDLWDELNRELNPIRIMTNIPPHVTMTVRFLGPFLLARRFYAPFGRFSREIDVAEIANLNPRAIDKAKKIIHDFVKPIGGFQCTVLQAYKEAIEILDKIQGGSMIWQKCILVNAFVRSGHGPGEPRIRIMTLTRFLCDAILSKTGNNQNAKLNGVFAHDVSITRMGEKLNTKFEANLMKQSALPAKDMEHILYHGLYNIPVLISEINNERSSSYHYSLVPNYKMPEEFTKSLFEGSKLQEEDKQLELVEEHLDEIPKEAFENLNKMCGPINSLEV